MSSVGDRIRRKVGEAIVVETYLTKAGLLQTGLAPVLSIFDETDVLFSTPGVSEPLTGLYRGTFTPDAPGIWHAKWVEATIPREEYRAYDVAATVAGDLLQGMPVAVDAQLTGTHGAGAWTGGGGGPGTCDIVEVIGV